MKYSENDYKIQVKTHIYINKTEAMSKCFCKNKIEILPKKNKAHSCTDFRTFNLLFHISKVLIKIVYQKIFNKANQYLENDQYELREQKETREAILGLRTLIKNKYYVIKQLTYHL